MVRFGSSARIMPVLFSPKKTVPLSHRTNEPKMDVPKLKSGVAVA